jgi:hypothetical protein
LFGKAGKERELKNKLPTPKDLAGEGEEGTGIQTSLMCVGDSLCSSPAILKMISSGQRGALLA